MVARCATASSCASSAPLAHSEMRPRVPALGAQARRWGPIVGRGPMEAVSVVRVVRLPMVEGQMRAESDLWMRAAIATEDMVPWATDSWDACG